LGAAGGRIDVTGANTLTIAGAITGGIGTITAGVSGSTGLRADTAVTFTKSGSGTLLLTGNATFTGVASVSEGVLAVGDGSFGSLAANVRVDSNGTLGGGGTVSGAVTVNSGGTVRPGLSIGFLSTGSVTFNSGSKLSLEIAGPAATSYDQLNVTGTVSLAGVIQLALSYTPAQGDVFYVILNDESDAISGTFAGLPQGSIFSSGNQQYRISYLADSFTGGRDGFNSTTGNDVALIAVPEPGSATALLSGMMLLGLRRFRRRD
jgi:autotransporter-associated beta strand protein